MMDNDILWAIDEITYKEQPNPSKDWALLQLEEELKKRLEEKLWSQLQNRTIDPTRLEDCIHPHSFLHRPLKPRLTTWTSMWALVRLARYYPSRIKDEQLCSAIEALTLEQSSVRKRWALTSLEKEFAKRLQEKLEVVLQERGASP
jgi:hypothetical protein